MDRNLLIRTLSGAVMLAVVLGAVLASPYSMALLFIAVAAGSMLEFYKFARLTGAAPLQVYPTVIGVLLVAAAFAVAAGLIGTAALLYVLPLVCGLFIAELYRKSTTPLTNVAWAVAGIVYVAVPLALLVVLPCVGVPGGGFVYRPLVVLSVIFIVWANDVGAYLVGRVFGRHRLFERISPKKSWEGTIGGVLLSVAVSLLFYWYYAERSNAVSASLAWYILAGVILAVGSFAGDLTESALKRTCGVKDSGHWIPGMGGAFDVLDSFIYNGVIFWILCLFMVFWWLIYRL